LSGSLFLQQLIKLRTGFTSFGVITFILTLASVFLKEAKEVKDLRVSGNVDYSSTALSEITLLRIRASLHGLSSVFRLRHSTSFSNIVLYLLHQLHELIEINLRVLSLHNLSNQAIHFRRVSLQTVHDGV